MTELLLVVHAALTWFMVGVIWFVQIVHYPLMAHVERTHFTDYEQNHTRLTGYVLAPLMLLELSTGIALLIVPEPACGVELPSLALLLLILIWGSTWRVQIPCHEQLTRTFDVATHRRLVRTNWFRTITWTIRGLLVLVMLLGKRIA